MRFVLPFILLNFSLLANASNLCAEYSRPGSIQQKLSQLENTLVFSNSGGMMNGGVCWWHSRFTRNAAYLADFRSELSKPTQSEAKKIIKAIRKGKRVVEIPGYLNLRSFSKDYQQLIQAELNDWQRSDGIFRMSWINGLTGKDSLSSDQLAQIMDDLYDEVVVEKKVVYQKLQNKGIVAHAWLVLGMTKIQNGYQLKVLDSNFLGYTKNITYTYGMTDFHYGYGLGDFVPYTQEEGELNRLVAITEDYCAEK